MQVKPRAVEPGYLWRWSKLAARLSLRHGTLTCLAWVLVSLPLVAFPLPVWYVTQPLLGLALVYLAHEGAFRADHLQPALWHFPEVLRDAGRVMRQEVRDNTFFWFLMTCLVATMLATSGAKNVVDSGIPVSTGTAWAFFFGKTSPFYRGAEALSLGWMLQQTRGWSYFLRRQFEVEDRTVMRLHMENWRLNPRVVILFEALPWLLWGVSVAVPLVVLPLCAFLSSFTYVAYREVFLGDKENGLPAKETVWKPALDTHH